MNSPCEATLAEQKQSYDHNGRFTQSPYNEHFFADKALPDFNNSKSDSSRNGLEVEQQEEADKKLSKSDSQHILTEADATDDEIEANG